MTWTSHIPGYKGYVSQNFHSVGDSYGRLMGAPTGSNDLHRPGLRQLLPMSSNSATIRENDRAVANTRTVIPHSRPVILRDGMKTGYMGTVPRIQHHFAKSYGYCSDGAVADFVRHLTTSAPTPPSERVYFRRRSDHLAAAVHPTHPAGGNHTRNPTEGLFVTRSTLRQVRPENEGYKERYTGFVPLKRDVIGLTYENASKDSFSNFLTNTQQYQQRYYAGAESGIESQHQHQLNYQYHYEPQLTPVQNRGQQLYRMNLAQLPMYGGHVPGKDYDYGRTYGKTTSYAADHLAQITTNT